VKKYAKIMNFDEKIKKKTKYMHKNHQKTLIFGHFLTKKGGYPFDPPFCPFLLFLTPVFWGAHFIANL
jgi:hypothetical protein